MPRTPDRFPGEREDEGIILQDQGPAGLNNGDPPAEGGLRFVTDRFKLRDEHGVFNARAVFISPTSAPTTAHDDSAGFSVGMLWLRVSTDVLYICQDNANGAAVWTVLAPLGWDASLAVNPSAGAHSPQIPAGQSLLFGTSPAGTTQQIRADGAFAIIASGLAELRATGALNNAQVTSVNNAVVLTAGGAISGSAGAGILLTAAGGNAELRTTGINNAQLTAVNNAVVVTAATVINLSAGTSINATATTGINLTPGTNQPVLIVSGLLRLVERAAGITNAAGQALIFAKDDTPNNPYFRDDANVDRKIATAPVPNADLATMATPRLKGRTTAGTGIPEDLTLTNSTSSSWDTTTGGTISVQRAALTGDITAPANSNTTAIAAGVIVDADVNASAAIAQTKTGALTGDVTKASGSDVTAIAAGVIVDADVNASAAIALTKIAAQAANTIVANPTGSSGTPSAVAVAADSVLARVGANLVSHPLATLSGAGLTYAAGVVDVGASASIIVGASDVQRAALTGDVTASQNSNGTTIANNAVSNAKAADMAANTLKGNPTGSTGDPQDVTVGANSILARFGSSALASAAPTASQVLASDGSGALAFRDGSAVVELLRWSTVQDAVVSTQQDNFALNADATALRFTVTGVVNLTGIAGGVAGRVLFIENTGATGVLTLVNQSSSSLSAARFRLPSSLTLGPHEGAVLMWDTTNSNWRVIATNAVSWAEIEETGAGPFNDYDAGGAATHLHIMASNVAGVFTGVVGASVAGRMLLISHQGTGTTTLVHNSVASGNNARFFNDAAGTSVVLGDNQTAFYIAIDATTGGTTAIRWFLVGLQPITVNPGQTLGLQIDAAGGSFAVPLTGAEQGENLRIGTVQSESGALPLAIALNADTTFLSITTAGTGDIRTVTGSALGRVVLVMMFGTGTKTIKHNFSAGTSSAFINPGLADFQVGVRDAFFLIGLGADGWQVVSAPLGVARVANAQLASMAVSTIKGCGVASLSGGAGAPQDLSPNDAGAITRFGYFAAAVLAAGTTTHDLVVADFVCQLYVTVTGTGDATLTGISHGGGGAAQAGHRIRIIKLGSGNRLLLPHDTGSTADNRFYTPNGVTYELTEPENEVEVGRNSSASGDRWRVVDRIIPTSGLANDAVTNPKLADMAAGTVKGRQIDAGSTGDPVDLTGAEIAEIIRWSNVATESTGGTLNNYTLSALVDVLRFTATAVLSGVIGGTTGRRLVIANGAAAGSGVTVDLLQFSTSTSGNRFLLPKATALRLYPGDAIEFLWGTLSNEWCALEATKALYRANSSGLGVSRSRLNFIDSATVALNAVDVGANDEVTLTPAVVAGSIGATQLAAGAVTLAKLSSVGNAAGDVFVHNGTDWVVKPVTDGAGAYGLGGVNANLTRPSIATTANLSCGQVYSIPANTLRAGSVYRFTGIFILSIVAGTRPAIRAMLTVGATTVPVTIATAAGQPAATHYGKIEAILRCESTGASGVIAYSINAEASYSSGNYFHSSGTQNTTTALSAELTVNMTTAPASASLTVQHGFIERVF